MHTRDNPPPVLVLAGTVLGLAGTALWIGVDLRCILMRGDGRILTQARERGGRLANRRDGWLDVLRIERRARIDVSLRVKSDTTCAVVQNWSIFLNNKKACTYKQINETHARCGQREIRCTETLFSCHLVHLRQHMWSIAQETMYRRMDVQLFVIYTYLPRAQQVDRCARHWRQTSPLEALLLGEQVLTWIYRDLFYSNSALVSFAYINNLYTIYANNSCMGTCASATNA